MKNLTKKQKITYVVITIIILAIIGTIIGVVTHKAKKPELIECKETEQQIKEEEVTNELPKDYKGEVDIVEEEIEVKGKDGKVEKKVVRKAVPKGQGKGKVVGTTNTNKMNTTKPTQKPTQKPNTTKPTKPNTTKPNTTKPQRKPTPKHLQVRYTEADIAKAVREAGLNYDYSLDPRKQNTGWSGYNSPSMYGPSDYVDSFKQLNKEGMTSFRVIFVDRSNYKTFTPQALGEYFPQSAYEDMCDYIETWEYEERDNKVEFYCFM